MDECPVHMKSESIGFYSSRLHWKSTSMQQRNQQTIQTCSQVSSTPVDDGISGKHKTKQANVVHWIQTPYGSRLHNKQLKTLGMGLGCMVGRKGFWEMVVDGNGFWEMALIKKGIAM